MGNTKTGVPYRHELPVRTRQGSTVVRALAGHCTSTGCRLAVGQVDSSPTESKDWSALRQSQGGGRESLKYRSKARGDDRLRLPEIRYSCSKGLCSHPSSSSPLILDLLCTTIYSDAVRFVSSSSALPAFLFSKSRSAHLQQHYTTHHP